MNKIIFTVLGFLIILNIGCVKDLAENPTLFDSTTTNPYIPSLADTTSIANLRDLDSGRVIFMNKCTTCHSLYKTELFTPKQWEGYVKSMGAKSSLSYTQDSLLLKYVTRGKLPLIDPSTATLYSPTIKDTTINASLDNLNDGRSIYITNCKFCHNYYTPESFIRAESVWLPKLNDSIHASLLSTLNYTFVINYLTKGALPAKPDFVSFKDIIIPLFNENCVTCHNPKGVAPGIDFSNQSTIYQNIYTQKGCGVDTLVPTNSGIYKTLTGSLMSGKLSESEMTVLLKWIKEGARNN